MMMMMIPLSAEKEKQQQQQKQHRCRRRPQDVQLQQQEKHLVHHRRYLSSRGAPLRSSAGTTGRCRCNHCYRAVVLAVTIALLLCADTVRSFVTHHHHPTSSSRQRRCNEPRSITTSSSSRLFVLVPPDQRNLALIPDILENDNNNNAAFGFYDLDDNENDESSFSPGEVIVDEDYTLDYISNEEDDDDDYNYNNNYAREEADMLEEREDRLYVDEFGIKRKVERCILLGVEDLSVKRKGEKQQRKNNQRANNVVAAAAGAAGAVPPETQSVYFTFEESMVEMRELVKTAGMELVGELGQRLHEINPKTYVGSGKVQEAIELLKANDCCTIVFDAELTPGQQKALENAFNRDLLQNDFLGQSGKEDEDEGEIKVLDRTALILDIFAQHAKTREGKLQVDLALHQYRKPRLTKMWTHLERQSGSGGVGLRGPGERQLEMDKRLLRDRISALQSKINAVQKQRDLHRRGRQRLGIPSLSIVGYTNAGKSSLLNYLTRAGVMAQSMLFATLDPTTRKVKLPGFKTHPEVLLTDTVGFIQKLPTHLVAAFRATLEEVREADVLVHVIDVSNPSWEKQEKAVQTVLREINAADKPVVRVLNKMDLLDDETAEYLRYEAATDTQSHTVTVSALYGDGMEDFVSVVEDALAELLVPIEVVIPYDKGDELSAVHEQGNVQLLDYRPEGTFVRALVPQAVANRLQRYDNSLHHQEEQEQHHHSESDTTFSTDDDHPDNDDAIDWVALGRGRHSATS